MSTNKTMEEAARELNPYSAPEFTTVWNQGFYAGASTPGMRWVKASEETPDNDTPVHCKINGLKRIGNFYENHENKKEFYVMAASPFSIKEKAFHNILWLDESASPENFVSKEHYDELKINYDIMVEENKRLNERERELVECLEWILVSDVWQHMRGRAIGNKVEAALSTHKP